MKIAWGDHAWLGSRSLLVRLGWRRIAEDFTISKDCALLPSVAALFTNVLVDGPMIAILVRLIVEKKRSIQVGAFGAFVERSLVDLGYVDL